MVSANPGEALKRTNHVGAEPVYENQSAAVNCQTGGLTPASADRTLLRPAAELFRYTSRPYYTIYETCSICYKKQHINPAKTA
jgi:hypothetical protein